MNLFCKSLKTMTSKPKLDVFQRQNIFIKMTIIFKNRRTVDLTTPYVMLCSPWVLPVTFWTSSSWVLYHLNDIVERWPIWGGGFQRGHVTCSYQTQAFFMSRLRGSAPSLLTTNLPGCSLMFPWGPGSVHKERCKIIRICENQIT